MAHAHVYTQRQDVDFSLPGTPLVIRIIRHVTRFVGTKAHLRGDSHLSLRLGRTSAGGAHSNS